MRDQQIDYISDYETTTNGVSVSLEQQFRDRAFVSEVENTDDPVILRQASIDLWFLARDHALELADLRDYIAYHRQGLSRWLRFIERMYWWVYTALLRLGTRSRRS